MTKYKGYRIEFDEGYGYWFGREGYFKTLAEACRAVDADLAEQRAEYLRENPPEDTPSLGLPGWVTER